MNIDNKNKLLRALVANNLACNTNLYGEPLRASEIAKAGEYFKTNVLAAGNCRIRRYKRTGVCRYWDRGVPQSIMTAYFVVQVL